MRSDMRGLVYRGTSRTGNTLVAHLDDLVDVFDRAHIQATGG
jgi:hypothetical protein